MMSTNRTTEVTITSVDEGYAAAFLGVSSKTLQGWRVRKKGPRYYKISNRVRYLIDDLKAFRDACVVEPESQN